jgi:hypothetical protein
MSALSTVLCEALKEILSTPTADLPVEAQKKLRKLECHKYGSTRAVLRCIEGGKKNG